MRTKCKYYDRGNLMILLNQKRDDYFDNIKALLIFLVVFGHILNAFSENAVANYLYKVIFSFHMPAFIFISGYFARCNPKKTIVKILPLYLVFQILQIVFRFFNESFMQKEWQPFHFQLFTPRWTLWYLLALIVFGVMLPLFESDSRKVQCRNIIISIVLAILIGFNDSTGNFMALSRIFSFLPFFLVGYYGHKNKERAVIWYSEWKTKAKFMTLLVAVLILAVFWFQRSHIHSAWFLGTLSFGVSHFHITTRIWTMALVFFWIVFLLVWMPSMHVGILSRIGKNTLPVYLLHTFIILLLLDTKLKNATHGNILILLALSVFLTILLSADILQKALKKINFDFFLKVKK